MKAHELSVGKSCRYQNTGCTRVTHDGDKIALVTRDFKLLFIDPEEELWLAFNFEGMAKPESDEAIVGHAINCMKRVSNMFELNFIQRNWEEQMKKLAETQLNLGSDETITDLHALDYIWNLLGDHVMGCNQVFHNRAIDFYLGRLVRHSCGVGKLMKIDYDYADERLCESHRDWFGHGRVWLSDRESEFNLPARGIHYGIKLEISCECGNEKYDMFAIPGIQTGGFGYLVSEDTDVHLDIRNHCRACEDCAPKIKAQLEAIERGEYSEEDEDEIE